MGNCRFCRDCFGSAVVPITSNKKFVVDESIQMKDDKQVRVLVLSHEQSEVSHKSDEKYKELTKLFHEKLEKLADLKHDHILPYKPLTSYSKTLRPTHESKSSFVYNLYIPIEKMEILSEVLKSKGTLEVETVKIYFEQLASALYYAIEEHKLSHMTIGLDKIYVSENSAYIYDFGLSKMVADFETEPLGPKTLAVSTTLQHEEAKDVHDLAVVILKTLYGIEFEYDHSADWVFFPQSPKISANILDLLRDMLNKAEEKRPIWKVVLERLKMKKEEPDFHKRGTNVAMTSYGGHLEAPIDNGSDVQLPINNDSDLINKEILSELMFSNPLMRVSSASTKPHAFRKVESSIFEKEEAQTSEIGLDQSLSLKKSLNFKNPLFHNHSSPSLLNISKHNQLFGQNKETFIADYGLKNVRGSGNEVVADMRYEPMKKHNPLMMDEQMMEGQMNWPEPIMMDVHMMEHPFMMSRPMMTMERGMMMDEPIMSDIITREVFQPIDGTLNRHIDIFKQKIEVLRSFERTHEFLVETTTALDGSVYAFLNSLLMAIDVCVLIKLMHLKDKILISLKTSLGPREEPFSEAFTSKGHMARLYHLTDQVCPDVLRDIEEKLLNLRETLPARFYRRDFSLAQMEQRIYSTLIKDVFLISLFYAQVGFHRIPSSWMRGNNELRVMQAIILGLTVCCFEADEWLGLPHLIELPPSLNLTKQTLPNFVTKLIVGVAEIEPIFAETVRYLKSWKETA